MKKEEKFMLSGNGSGKTSAVIGLINAKATRSLKLMSTGEWDRIEKIIDDIGFADLTCVIYDKE